MAFSDASFVKDLQYSLDSNLVLSADSVIVQPSSKLQPFITLPSGQMHQQHQSRPPLSIIPHSSSPPVPSLGSSSSTSQHSSHYDSDSGSSPLPLSDADELPSVHNHHHPAPLVQPNYHNQQKRAIVHPVQPMMKCQSQNAPVPGGIPPYPSSLSSSITPHNHHNKHIPFVPPFSQTYTKGDTPFSTTADEPCSSGDDQDSGLAPCSPLYRSDEMMVLSSSASSEDVPKLFDLDTSRRDDWESSLNSSDRSDEPEPSLSSLDEQLQLLSTERNKVKADIALNEKLGAKILYRVEQCDANELDKKKLNRHLVETGKILALRYKLHRRMNRVKWALNHVNTEEVKRKDRLEAEKINLQCQIDDAETLKEIVEKRTPEVDRLLSTVLPLGQRLEYKHFFEEMQKLLAEIHEIDQRISVFQEKKLLAVNQSLSARSLKSL